MIIPMLMRPDEALVFPEFVSRSHHQTLLEWVKSQFSLGKLNPNPYGDHRYFSSYEGLTNIPSEFWQVRDEFARRLELSTWTEEPEFKCYLSCNQPGGFVHRHRDYAPPGKYHVRCNLMISKPEGGGLPCIEGHELPIDERSLWAFHPSERFHWSTAVQGDKPRFTCSFGFLIDVKSMPLLLEVDPDVSSNAPGARVFRLLPPAVADEG